MKQKPLNLSIYLGLILIMFNSFSLTNIDLVNTKTNEDNDEKAKQVFELGETFFKAKKYKKAKSIFLNIIENDTTRLYNQD